MTRKKLSPNFFRDEFACKCGCGFSTVDAELLALMQEVRDNFGPISILSGHRCERHNRNVGGSPGSFHLQGKACDFYPQFGSLTDVVQWLSRRLPSGYGIGYYPDQKFIHLDVGEREWRQNV